MKPKQLFQDKVFCPAPWNNLYINPDGTTHTCSIGKFSLGNLHDKDVTDIVKDNTMLKSIQKSMIEGKRHKNCDICYDLEDWGLKDTLRTHYKKTITDFENLLQYDTPDGDLEIRSFDLRYDNTCQNACVFCDATLSSRWEKELDIKIPKPTNTIITKEYVLKNLHLLKEIYLAGGEPLVNKDFVTIMNKLYEVNPNCKVRINSNIRNIKTPAYELSKKFKNLRYTISADATNKQFEYIRYPQAWESFETNVATVMQEVPSYNFNMVLNVLNVFGLFDCIDYLRSIGAHDNSFMIIHAYFPKWCDIRNLPEDILQDFLNKCDKYMSETNTSNSLYTSLLGCKNFVIDRQSFKKDLQDTQLNLDILNIRRNLNSRKYFPYIYN
tara:strand:+ start:186 stop:1331 length:1146 start_codon:yes stop_codon:yes gene_type:complete